MAAHATAKAPAPASSARVSRAPSTAPQGAAASVLALQRQVGNRATTAVLARCGAGGCSCGGACGGAGHRPEDDELLDELR